MYESQTEGSVPYSSFWWLLSREWHDDYGVETAVSAHKADGTWRKRGACQGVRREPSQ